MLTSHEGGLKPADCGIVSIDGHIAASHRQAADRPGRARGAASTQFGDMDDGSRQADLWGINLYPAETGDTWIEFDALINVRPSHGNRSGDVEDEARRHAIRRVVDALVAAA